jgi:hypothetical protein
MGRNKLEKMALVAIRRAGGMQAGVGAGVIHTLAWCRRADVELEPAADGVAQDGSVDEDGNPNPAGRGMSIFDACIEVDGIMVPVSLKGGDSRDISCKYKEVRLLAMTGLPLWTFKLKVIGGELMMRRIDVSRVIREAPAAVTDRRDARVYGVINPANIKPSGDPNVTYEVERGPVVWKDREWPWRVTRRYLRTNVKWSKVPDHMYLDQTWVPFDPSLPSTGLNTMVVFGRRVTARGVFLD